ncbi:hypothetical protein [Mycobacteroides chelonae]|uniref:hypothetical protein n=1 Tax=Mycobacteroides chelonae TaxID=1774 RepID=UPI001F3DC93A|nr:hypothetical protein [Mycobacteroides chelonae]UJW67150.1 hypothetical protein H0I67_07515 [Mycobacteroides chelonae]
MSTVTLESQGISPLASLAFAPKPELRSLGLELAFLPMALAPESRTSWGRLAFEILQESHAWLRPLHRLVQTTEVLDPIVNYLDGHPRNAPSAHRLMTDIQRLIENTGPADPYLREALTTLVQDAWNAAVDRFEAVLLPTFRPADAEEQLTALAAAITQTRSMARSLRTDEHHGLADALGKMLMDIGFPLSQHDRVLESVASGEPMSLAPLSALPVDSESED